MLSNFNFVDLCRKVQHMLENSLSDLYYIFESQLRLGHLKLLGYYLNLILITTLVYLINKEDGIDVDWF